MTAHTIAFKEGLDLLPKVRSSSKNGQRSRQNAQNSNDGMWVAQNVRKFDWEPYQDKLPGEEKKPFVSFA
jgi:hypothetical protein